MTKEIQPTAEELDMLRIKREQDALKKKEDDLKEQERLNKEIVDKRREIAAFKKSRTEYMAAADKYCQDCEKHDIKLKRVEIADARVFDVKRYPHNKPNSEDTDYDRPQIMSSESVGFVNIRLSYDKEHYADIKAHNPWSGWSSKFSGYKLFIEGCGYEIERRPYTSVKTVYNKIKEHLEIKKNVQTREQLEAEGFNKAYALIKKKYLGLDGLATFEKKECWVGSGHRGSSYKVNKVVVTFSNELVVSFRFSYDGKELSIWRGDVELPNFDTDEVINALIGLKVKKEKE